jgi:hypothetical protein
MRAHGQIHFVHYKMAYGDAVSAMSHGDGLAVVGVFLEVCYECVETQAKCDAGNRRSGQ